jgi:hypothetical protein
MAIEIVDLPSYKMVIFHSFLYVYQRVPSGDPTLPWKMADGLFGSMIFMKIYL